MSIVLKLDASYKMSVILVISYTTCQLYLTDTADNTATQSTKNKIKSKGITEIPHIG